MKIRDRIKELRRVRADRLRPNPRNWRTHPETQQDALRGILAEVGYADALLARELPDGSLELIDGHLRAQTTPEVKVPVLILDLDDEETAKLLALHDPLAGLAEVDDDALADLLEHVETENAALEAVLDNIISSPAPALESDDEPPPEVEIPEAFQVVIECEDETQQKELYERFAREGLKCRLVNL